MKNKFKLFFVATIILSHFAMLPSQAAKVDPMRAQSEVINALGNPHPPETEEDKQRVAFAENVISTLLKTTVPQTPPNGALQVYDSHGYNFNLDADCLRNESCLQNPDLQTYLKYIFTKLGSVVEFKNSHIIPWSFQHFLKPVAAEHSKSTHTTGQPSTNVKLKHSRMVVDQEPMPAPVLQKDEYIIHVYAKLANQHWYHLDVIVSEDANGKITFRRFFFFEVPTNNQSLPDGVVC